MDDLAQPFRRRLVACGAAAWAAALWPRIAAATTSQAKTWPNRPLKIVVPYAPGGPHITCEALNRKHGSAALHVPYRGLAPLTQDLVARRIGAAFGVAPAFQPFVETGRLRVLGVTGAQRVPAFPDVPTFAEQGFDDDAFQLRVWLGFLAPASTPRAIVTQLNAQIVRCIRRRPRRARCRAPASTSRMRGCCW